MGGLGIELGELPPEETPAMHRWWSRRGDGASMVAVLLTNEPGLATDRAALQRIAEHPREEVWQHLDSISLLDLCSGSCDIAAAAAQLGARTTAVDSHPIPVLIGRARLIYPAAFGRSDSSARGSDPEGRWAGLTREVAHWARELQAKMRSGAGELWLDECDGVVVATRLKCPKCGANAPVSVEGERPGCIKVQRNEGTCPACGGDFTVTAAEFGGFEPVGVIQDGEARQLEPDLHNLLASAGYPGAMEPLLSEPFAFGFRGVIPLREAMTPRQAQILRVGQEAIRSIRNELADLEYEPQRAQALLTYLALGISGVLDLLCMCTQWSERKKRPIGLVRHEWSRSFRFLEIGGTALHAALTRRFEEIEKGIELHLTNAAVAVRNADMTALGESTSSFDLVVWDPPYYDNIPYSRLALPWTKLLRSIIGDLDTSLHWPSDASHQDQSAPFNRDRFEEDLRRTVAEIGRVLRPSGRLGVFWFHQAGSETEHLRSFLGVLEHEGFELIQTVGFARRSTSGVGGEGRPQAVILVFRRTVAVQPSDAGALLAGEEKGHAMMVAGLVEVLERYLDKEDIEDIIPADFRGTRSERLTEVVLTTPDPQQYLRRLRKRDLREFAEVRGCRLEELAVLDQAALASLVFRLLGWRTPEAESFTVGGALDHAAALVSQLRLALNESEVRGLASAGLSRLEEILRFSVVSWSVKLRGANWRSCLVDLLGKSERMAFGHWFRAFRDLPGRYAAEDRTIGGANARLRRAQVMSALEAAVEVRNDIAHPDPFPDWNSVRGRAVAVLESAIERIRKADAAGALPRLLQPVMETRDPFGRITLRAVGHGGRHDEFLLLKPSDLTVPIVVVPGGTNPREVDPVRLDGQVVLREAGLVGEGGKRL